MLMGFAEPVPWAYILTDITAKYPVFSFLLQLIRKLVCFQFNGKIGDALGSIQGFVGQNGGCGAGINAFGTGSTVVLLIFSDYLVLVVLKRLRVRQNCKMQ